jgi:glycosyltransferase involved in cell wall biosynthesis
MNVLYLTQNVNRASSNVPTEGWFRHLRRRGLAPVVVSPGEGAFQQWTRAESIPTYTVSLPFPDRRVWRYLQPLGRLRSIVRRHRIQVIHAIEQGVFPIAADLGRVSGVPVVVGVHSRLDVAFGRWAFARWRCPTRLYFLTAASRAVCEPAIEGVVPADRCQLLYNGIDLERVRPDADAAARFRRDYHLGDGLLFGAASWLRPGKQLEHVVRAAASIVDRDFGVVLAGGVAPGEESYAESFLDMARRTLGSRLHYVGCLDDLTGFYSALDFYVNTSLEETCSISIIEALASGCPVVGYPSVSVGEQILPTGGEVTRQDDEAALASAVRRWLSDPTEIAGRRLGARQRAEAVFDIRRIADQLWDDYQQFCPSS